jgi:hypothetical protein
VAAFRRNAGVARSTCLLDVQPNRPKTFCRSLVALRRAGGKWNVEAALRTEVADGELDELWLDISDRLVEPFQLDPPADYAVQTVPGQARRRLVIRPARPLSGQTTFVLRAPLATPTGEPVAVADVVPLEMDDLEHYLVVPVQAEGQRFVWQPSGVQGASLPDEPSLPPVGDEAVVWRVVAPRYAVSLRLSESLAAVPAQVHLADIHLAWDASGACRGLAAFDLEPAGLSSCLLELPAPYRLVQARVGGLPATLIALDSDRWRLALGPAQLPQRVEVLFDGRLELHDAARRTLAAPRLAGVSVERTLWTLYPPPGEGLHHVPSENITAASQQLSRYEAASRMLERGADVVVEQSRQDIERWYLPWARRLAVLRESLLAASRGLPLAPSDLERMEAVARQQQDVEQRLKVAHLPGLAPTSPGARELWELVQPGRASVVRRTFTGAGAGKIDLEIEPPPSSPRNLRWLAAVAFALAAVILFALAWRGRLGDWLLRWPHAVGVLAGLAWWLWLTPSALGWLVVLVSVVAALRRPWKGVAAVATASPSSIVRHRA